MIGNELLESMGSKLRVYDVDQKGWEHEGQGFVKNTEHVFRHLIKDLVLKSFEVPDTVMMALAPDSVQYALRLQRWTNSSVDQVRPTTLEFDVAATRSQAEGISIPKAAFTEAIGDLAKPLHDLDHEKQQQAALTELPTSAILSARFLLLSAVLQSQQGAFDLEEAFDFRLAELRDRFSIPQPQGM